MQQGGQPQVAAAVRAEIASEWRIWVLGVQIVARSVQHVMHTLTRHVPYVCAGLLMAGLAGANAVMQGGQPGAASTSGTHGEGEYRMHGC